MTSGLVPEVSVCVITYNHASFIRDCLEGILRQKTSFNFEVVVGEDASSDDTLSICREFSARDERLRVFAGRENKGMITNFLDTLGECRGTYIALCEGDDYWIDAEKLQAQYEFLEASPGFSICFHNALVEYPDGSRRLWRNQGPPTDMSVSSLFAEWLMPTASVVFRNPGTAYPPYMRRATHGDLALFVYLADAGRIGYLDRTMSVYRRHPAGIMSSFSGVDFNERQIEFLCEMSLWFNRRYERPIGRRIARLKRSTAIELAARGAWRRVFAELHRSLAFADWRDPGFLVDVAKVLLLTVLPPRSVAWFHRWRNRWRAGGV